MRQGLRKVLCACVVFGFVSLTNVFSQESQTAASTQDDSGEVVSVDVKNSTVTIKQLTDETAQTYDTTIYAVEKSASIAEGDLVKVLSDLKPGDKVAFVYLTTPDGGKLIRSIVVVEE